MFHPAAHLLNAFQHGGRPGQKQHSLSTGSPRATSCSTGSGPAKKFKQHFHIAICCSGTAMRQWAPPSFFGMTLGADPKKRQVPPAPSLGPSTGPVDGRDGSAPMGRRRLKEGECPASQPFECQPHIPQHDSGVQAPPPPPRMILVCCLLPPRA